MKRIVVKAEPATDEPPACVICGEPGVYFPVSATVAWATWRCRGSETKPHGSWWRFIEPETPKRQRRCSYVI